MAIYKRVTSVVLQAVEDGTGTLPFYIARFTKAQLQALLDSATQGEDIGIFYGADTGPGTPPPRPADFFMEITKLDTNSRPIQTVTNPKAYLPCPPYCHAS